MYGVRAVVTLLAYFGASGRDSWDYFDVYLGVFTNSPATSSIEAGIGYYSEQHLI